ncbi:kinase binding protein CGI-121-domain-containing protein [Dipodascopsis uninucleata]
MAIATFKIPQFPGKIVQVRLFSNVTNAKDIKEALIEGREDIMKLQCSFLDASAVYSLDQVLAAVYRAITDCEAGSMRTKTLPSEIILAMSPSMNITESLRRFGIQDSSSSLFIVRVRDERTDTAGNITLEEQEDAQFNLPVVGTELPVTDHELQHLTQISTIRKNYKIPQGFATDDRHQTNKFIVGAIALRGYL